MKRRGALRSSPVPGTTVRWNGRRRGVVQSVNDGTAVVVERDNPLFGRTVTWRLDLAALTVVEPEAE